MSGGSYNYLYSHTEEVGEHKGMVKAMRDRLEELEKQRVPGAAYAARRTRMVLCHLKLAEQHAQALENVWHAVEWRDSCDWGDDQLREVLAEFLEER